MNTYLIFFGKSQDFNFHVFDSTSYIANFDSVIKNFDLLESRFYTIDDVDNKPILAKYIFNIPNRRSYSLLKLYSFAQALHGNRVGGSIYGVALLSEMDLTFSKENLDLLKAAKAKFAELSLNGLKFNKSDFKEDVFKIWNGIINHKEGNYFNRIGHKPFQKEIAVANLKAYFVHSLFDDALALNRETSGTAAIYLSEDLAHLQRANKQWGSKFPIYHQVNLEWVKYVEEIKPPKVEPLFQVVDASKPTSSPTPTRDDDVVKLYQMINQIQRKSQYQTISLSLLSVIIIVLGVKIFNLTPTPVLAPTENKTGNYKHDNLDSQKIPTSFHFPPAGWDIGMNKDFRKWVSEQDSAYAKSIDLSKEGPIGANEVKTAWKKYGAEYLQSLQAKQ